MLDLSLPKSDPSMQRWYHAITDLFLLQNIAALKIAEGVEECDIQLIMS